MPASVLQVGTKSGLLVPLDQAQVQMESSVLWGPQGLPLANLLFSHKSEQKEVVRCPISQSEFLERPFPPCAIHLCPLKSRPR